VNISDNVSMENTSGTCDKKLVMTLLVRDEADIVRQNIEFHLAHGVDFIIATDNLSVDGTREILQEYEKKGLLRLIVEEDRRFDQAKWVNRMGKLAYEEHGADIIIHCDADEFWSPRSGNLKNEILSRDVDALYARLSNVLMRNRGGAESFPEDTIYAVAKPLMTANLRKEWKKTSQYLFKCMEKVFFKTTGGFLEVTNGNHNIARCDRPLQTGISQDILIYHYPLRGKAHFYRKVKNGGSALASNPKFSKGTGLHWRIWYDSYLKGRLDEEYSRLTLKDEEAGRLLADGVIEGHDFLKLLSEKVPDGSYRFDGPEKPGCRGKTRRQGKFNKLLNRARILNFNNARKSWDYISAYGFRDFLRKVREALGQHQR